MFPKEDSGLSLTDGEQKYPVLPHEMPNEYNYGRIAPGKEFVLEFPLPKSYDRSKSLELVIPRGVVSWEAPKGQFDLLIWQEPQIELKTQVNNANRTYRLTATVLEGEAKEFIWEVPGREPVTTATPIFEQQLFQIEPFEVKVTAVMTDGSKYSKQAQVVTLEDGQVLVAMLKNIKLRETMHLPLPQEAITEQALADGKISLHFIIKNTKCGWTMFPKEEPGLSLTDGEKRYAVLPHEMANEFNYGRITPDIDFVLYFPLPKPYDRSKPLELTIPGGIASWEAPEGQFDLLIFSAPKEDGE